MNARQQARAAFRASVKLQAQIKQETERIEQEQRNEHDTTAPGAQSLPFTSRRPGLHDSPQPQGLGSQRPGAGE